MNDPLKIIGANGKRRENDFYPTPPECTYALLDYLRQNFLLRSTDTIWEPACGNNAMVDVMVQQGHSVIATDITQGQDFLEYEMQDHFDWIITNPPFYLSEKFIKRCIEYGKPFALLLKSQYWHSAKRRELFHSQPPPICIAVDMETRLHRKRLVYDGYGMDRVDRQLKEHILRAPCKTEKNGGSEMKAVMLSIQPKWCEKIASGEKTVEVRKTRPKIETPFKCFIYETNWSDNTYWKNRHKGKLGKVIGEFVCDRIDEYHCRAYDGGFAYPIPTVEGEKTGLTYGEAAERCAFPSVGKILCARLTNS